MRPIDITGQRFARLVVMELHTERRGGQWAWVCRCDCGETTIVRSAHLRNGHTTSCGCWGRTNVGVRSRKLMVNYFGAHCRVAARRGSASSYPCIDCGKSARDWCYNYADPQEARDEKNRRYSLSPAYYDPRCRLCHKTFDLSAKSVG